MAPTLDKKPECGDLIKIDRGSYQHWAIYIGDSFVVHLAAPSFLHTKAMVKKEKLLDVVGTNKWEINNSLDEKYKPRPIPIFVKEACELVGQELSYSVFRENCEHFVNVLRYGEAISVQTEYHYRKYRRQSWR
ncbi:phospholipase A and acyltransferase 3-like isoform X3 [Channa argus]|uniref:phospholipase A and acyltransferase 3-like isoform X3 n=1 Tax=Channa argus TaxID=215402 RepID=UPI0035213F5B